MNYSALFRQLQNHNIRYVVCGGLAVNLHGIPRMTADIDLILDLSQENLLAFQKCVSELNYHISVPIKITEMADQSKREKIKEEKNLVAISFYNYDKNFLALDVLIDFPIAFEELWKNKIIRKEGDIAISLVSIDHLIQLKEFAGRIQDKEDIYFLSKIKNGK
jgi:hypothetical protein